MHNVYRICIVLSLIALAAAGAVALARYLGPPDVQPSATLEVPNSELRLGLIDEKEKLAHSLTIMNRSSSSLTLKKIGTNCQCVQTAKLDGIRLALGESVALPLKLKVFASPKADLAKEHAFESVIEVAYETAEGDKKWRPGH